MATQRLGRIVPLHRGEYDDRRRYELNDIVSYHGSTYWHHRHESTQGVPPDDIRVWFIVTDMRAAEHLIKKAEKAAHEADRSADTATRMANSAAASAQEAERTSERIDTEVAKAERAAEDAQASAQEAQDTVDTIGDAVERANTAADTATEASESAATSATVAQQALEGMTFVTFTMDEHGHIVIQNGDMLGTTEFIIQFNNGHLEVEY